MALAHARRLIVDGVECLWTASIPPRTLNWETEHMTLAIQRTTGGPKLVAYAAARVDGTPRAITPRAIRKIIEVALERGWTTDQPGPDFALGVEAREGKLQAPQNVALRARALIEELRS
jgi:hypothetical protein